MLQFWANYLDGLTRERLSRCARRAGNVLSAFLAFTAMPYPMGEARNPT